MIEEINSLKREIDSYRPMSASFVKQVRQFWRIGLTYSSNALEGNTLTETETKVLLEDGLTVAGKSLREVYEAVGHSDAMDLLYDLVEKKQPVSEQVILDFHRRFFERIDKNNAGVYRGEQVFISGTDYIPPKADKVESTMKKGIVTIEALKEHPAILAAKWHCLVADVHPFIDGNGRTARLLMNLNLLQHGFPIASIPLIYRAEYIASCAEANKGNDSNFLAFIQKVLVQSMKDYLRMLKSVN